MDLDIAILNSLCYISKKGEVITGAIGITGKRIAQIGTDYEIQRNISSKTTVIDGRKKTLVPGFIDAHTHFINMGLELLGYHDLGGSKTDVLQKLSEGLDAREKDEWIVGFNVDHSKWLHDERITKKELDRRLCEEPMVLYETHGNTAFLNSLALKDLDITASLEGAKTLNGELTGEVVGKAKDKVVGQVGPTQQELISAIKCATKKAHQLGVTGISDAGNGFAQEKRFKAYKELSEEKELLVRANLFFNKDYREYFFEERNHDHGDHARFHVGAMKIFADGSIGAKSAWVSEEYIDKQGNYGSGFWDFDELKECILECHRRSTPVAVHAIGDRAIKQVLEVIETTQSGGQEIRDRVEHCELIHPDQILKMKKLGIMPVMQPNMVGKFGRPGGMYEDRLGLKRIQSMNPFSLMIKEGGMLAFGSDGIPFDPLFGLHWAVNTPFELQRVSPKQAVRAYTIGSAKASGFEDYVGSIEEGKLADLVLLNGSLFKDTQNIAEMKPKLTIFNGKIVYFQD